MVRRLTDFHCLQYCCQLLARVQHRLRIPQLLHDLLRTVSLPSLRHRDSSSPLQGLVDSHNDWFSFWGAGQSPVLKTEYSVSISFEFPYFLFEQPEVFFVGDLSNV